MNENQNELTTNEESKKKAIQKNFKFSDESNRDELNKIIGELEVDGKTDGDKMLNLIKAFMSKAEYNDVIAEANNSLSKVYESNFIELELLQRTILDKFRSLMVVANAEIGKNTEDLTGYYEKKVARLESMIEQLESKVDLLTSENEKLTAMLDSKEHSVTEANTRVEDLTKNLEAKEQSIELYKGQLQAKDDLIEESKKQTHQLNESIVKLTTTQQDHLSKIDELRSENEELKASYQESNQVISGLSMDIKEKDMKIQFTETEIERLRQEMERIHETNKEGIERLQRELANERQSKSELQDKLIELMGSLTNQPTPTIVKDGEKDSVATKPTKKTFVVTDQKGKQHFKGSQNELVKYVNGAVKPEPKVTSKTSLEEIRNLLSPLTLKVIEK